MRRNLLLYSAMIALAALVVAIALAGTVPSAGAALTLAAAPDRPLADNGSGFTYQGSLTDNGAPADGNYDFVFRLYDDDSAGNLVAGPLSSANQMVADGLFTILLDFGAGAFDGAARWIEIDVAPAGGSYTTLAPRQALTATPYALSLSPGAVISGSLAGGIVSLTNNGIGAAIAATGPTGGVFTGTNGPGIEGRGGTNTAGVWGENSGDGFGVYGTSTINAGVNGVSSSGAGVAGISSTGAGVSGASPNNYGVLGASNGTSGVRGIANKGYSAVQGDNTGIGPGIGGSGVYGGVFTGTTQYGVYATNGGGVAAIYGTNAGAGSVASVYGNNTSSGRGVLGVSVSGAGVRGQSTNGAGVEGSGLYGGVFTSTITGGYGVKATAGNDAAAVYGINTGNGYGISGEATTNDGVHGTSSSGVGVSGNSGSSSGTSGTSSSGVGVDGVSSGNHGVRGRTSSGLAAVQGTNLSNGPGVAGSGVYGGVFTGTIAGKFQGNVQIFGTMQATGAKSFVIDHPLDPANSYLYHAAVEGPERYTLYNGTVTLDSSGAATAALPDYFEALNRDFQYQLTPIGAAMPGLYVAQEISGNRFAIAGGAPGAKVSWLVIATRDDPYAQDHPYEVEVSKPTAERGTYLYPEGYGGSNP